MPEELTTQDPPTDDESDETATPLVHDDIMKRLLDYQRNLREGATPDEAATPQPGLIDYAALETEETAGDRLVDLATAEAELEDTSTADSTTEIDATGSESAEDDSTEPVVIEVEDAPIEKKAEPAAISEAEPATNAQPSTAAKVANAELEARMTELERSLDGIADMLGELRKGFQDMAIDADERIAKVEDALAEARRSAS